MNAEFQPIALLNVDSVSRINCREEVAGKKSEEETKIKAAKFRKSKEGKRNLSARFIPGKRFGHFGERAVEIIYELFEILALEDSNCIYSNHSGKAVHSKLYQTKVSLDSRTLRNKVICCRHCD